MSLTQGLKDVYKFCDADQVGDPWEMGEMWLWSYLGQIMWGMNRNATIQVLGQIQSEGACLPLQLKVD